MKWFLRFSLPVILMIGISYGFLDRPLCQWIHDQGIPQQLSSLCMLGHWPPVTDENTGHISLVTQLVEWPPLITGMAPILLIAALFLPSGRARQLLILMGFSVLMTFVLKNDLKWIFSRYWPLTWTHQNLSWISNHAYGFQWFHGKIFLGNDETGSFPSGHTAVAFAALLPIGLIYRRLLLPALFLALMEGFAMVAFDYHFLSDVMAGAMVGIFCTFMVGRLLGVSKHRERLFQANE
jgi:membrane-associated phospholipid phosphatase